MFMHQSNTYLQMLLATVQHCWVLHSLAEDLLQDWHLICVPRYKCSISFWNAIDTSFLMIDFVLSYGFWCVLFYVHSLFIDVSLWSGSHISAVNAGDLLVNSLFLEMIIVLFYYWGWNYHKCTNFWGECGCQKKNNILMHLKWHLFLLNFKFSY